MSGYGKRILASAIALLTACNYILPVPGSARYAIDPQVGSPAGIVEEETVPAEEDVLEAEAVPEENFDMQTDETADFTENAEQIESEEIIEDADAEAFFTETVDGDHLEISIPRADVDGNFGRAFFSEDGGVKNAVPRFYQTNYPKVWYGDGSVATSGCSMTTMAMVVTYLTGEKVSPTNLAKRFRLADGSHMQRMEAIATIYDLDYTKTFDFSQVMKALREGKIVVEMVGKQSVFTKTQHFVLLTGLTSDGKILVNDSAAKNQKDKAVLKGYKNGFKTEVLKAGFQGAWIFEPYSPPEKLEGRYGKIKMTDSERDMLAKLIWLEARGEPFLGQQAVAEVVLNRFVSSRFQNETIKGVIKAKDQFRTVKYLSETRADELQYKAIDRALSGPNVLPLDVFYFAQEAPNKNVWGRIGGHCFCYAPD